ncbi:von Willebrand factor A domain-containing protein 5A-like isoform X1 [Alosa sapidissima]|uniref:von Willebrand factor A domain-containing protein 5A-like isoform X1 n=2 Tax=Alosa sapidissima TaxID=34773 RepID=UPI001C085ADE|nr:von Willebrand factor A domain-containing protein 5A-like isoform X1 [Alosa sapidissima]
MVRCCGLVTVKNEPVPLKSVEVDVHVQGHVATVTSTLLYVNGEERPLEAVFVFPLPGECAVCHLSAKIGDTEVVAKLQDKQKAREEYDDALSSGHQAFLLEESDQSPDVFQLNVGSLPPGESAAITLVYISELDMQADDALRFCLPAVLNPRYTPQDMDRSQMATVTSVPAGTVPYTLALSAHLSSPQPISKVESNCDLEPLAYLNPDKTQATVSLSPGHLFDRDVELLLYYHDAHKPTAIVEAGLDTAEPGSLMRDPVVLLSIYPEFPAAVTSSLSTCGEFIFVVDRSGSMDCAMHSGKDAKKKMRIESAKDTLLLLLKSLPMGCYFNIYGFGSRYEHFFPKSVEYNQKTMDDALEKVKGMRADMGGTEILQPLKHIYSQPCIPSHPRQLFIFTDGEVGNTKQVLDLVKINGNSHRCFSFGIGQGASTALITGLAKEASGHAQFITGTDRMQPKVMQSLRYALQPAVKDISVHWNLPDGVSVTTLSPPLKVLFHGQRALLYAQLKGENAANPEGSVTIQYNLLEETVKNQLSFCLRPTGDTGVTLHRLGARTLIRSLEMEERAAGPEAKALREKLLQLSLQSGVSCTHTAFIAIHKGSGQTVQGPLLHRTVPTPGMFIGAPMALCCSMPMTMPMARMAPMRKMANMAPMARMAAVPAMLPVMMCCDSMEDDDEMFDGVQEPESPPDPLLQLISLQKASGSWEMESSMAKVLKKTDDELDKLMPVGVDKAVWATVLALIWLYGFRLDARDEWQFVAMKAASWIQAQKVDCVSQCVQAGNALLGCQLQQKTLGL